MRKIAMKLLDKPGELVASTGILLVSSKFLLANHSCNPSLLFIIHFVIALRWSRWRLWPGSQLATRHFNGNALDDDTSLRIRCDLEMKRKKKQLQQKKTASFYQPIFGWLNLNAQFFSWFNYVSSWVKWRWVNGRLWGSSSVDSILKKLEKSGRQVLKMTASTAWLMVDGKKCNRIVPLTQRN